MQVPGLLLVGVALALLWPSTGLPSWIAFVIAGGWVVKDLAVFPLVRTAYEAPAPTGAAQLVGTRGIVRRRVESDGHGYVSVRGERWRARAAVGCAPIEAGREIVVTDARGLELTVEAAREADHASPASLVRGD